MPLEICGDLSSFGTHAVLIALRLYVTVSVYPDLVSSNDLIQTPWITSVMDLVCFSKCHGPHSLIFRRQNVRNPPNTDLAVAKFSRFGSFGTLPDDAM